MHTYLGTITFANTAEADGDANNEDKKVIFKNWAPFTGCMNKINNMQIGNAKDIYVVTPRQGSN